MNKEELLEAIQNMVTSGKLYVVNKHDHHMEIQITDVEVDPDGDIKLVAEVMD